MRTLANSFAAEQSFQFQFPAFRMKLTFGIQLFVISVHDHAYPAIIIASGNTYLFEQRENIHFASLQTLN